jgi:hypothetical protein
MEVPYSCNEPQLFVGTCIFSPHNVLGSSRVRRSKPSFFRPSDFADRCERNLRVRSLHLLDILHETWRLQTKPKVPCSSLQWRCRFQTLRLRRRSSVFGGVLNFVDAPV